MSAEWTYDYALVRVVPRPERGERINVGVILSCVDHSFLDARVDVDAERLRALDPELDVDTVRAALVAITTVCAGGSAAGDIGALSSRERFRWLVSPRSTVIQMSSVHTGRTSDPTACLDRLFDKMVRHRA